MGDDFSVQLRCVAPPGFVGRCVVCSRRGCSSWNGPARPLPLARASRNRQADAESTRTNATGASSSSSRTRCSLEREEPTKGRLSVVVVVPRVVVVSPTGQASPRCKMRISVRSCGAGSPRSSIVKGRLIVFRCVVHAPVAAHVRLPWRRGVPPVGGRRGDCAGARRRYRLNGGSKLMHSCLASTGCMV